MLVSGQNDRHYQKLASVNLRESRSLSPEELLERMIQRENVVINIIPVVVVAEWLRRFTRNPLGSPRY